MTTSSRNVIWCAQSTVHSFGIPCQIPMSRASHVLRNAGLVLGLFGDQEPGYPADMLALTASWQSFTQCHPLDSGIAPPCFLFWSLAGTILSGFSTLVTFVDVCVSFCVCSKWGRIPTWTVLATVRGIIQFDHSVCDLACFVFCHSTCLATVNVFSNLRVTHGSRAAANSPTPLWDVCSAGRWRAHRVLGFTATACAVAWTVDRVRACEGYTSIWFPPEWIILRGSLTTIPWFMMVFGRMVTPH